MTKPMMRIHNTKTNEVIDRELTDEELIQYNLQVQNIENLKLKKISKEQNQQSAMNKLSALGLTDAEIKALIGA